MEPEVRENEVGGAQIRAARALLDWSATDLAEESGVSRMTVQRIERQNGSPLFARKTIPLIRSALERAGIEFLGDPDRAPGLRLSHSRKT